MKYLGILFIVFSSILVNAQNSKKTDSLEQVLETLPEGKERISILLELGIAFIYNNDKPSKQYLEEALHLSEKLDFRDKIMKSNFNLGIYYNGKGDYNTALRYYNAFDQLATDASDKARVKLAKAIAYVNLGDLDKSLIAADSTIVIYTKEIDDPISLGIGYSLKSQILQEKGHYNLALNAVLKSIETLKPLDNKLRLCNAMMHLGQLKHNLEKYNESIKHQQEALKLLGPYNNKLLEGDAYSAIGQSYYELKNYKKAEENYLAGLNRYNEIKNKDKLAFAYGNLGKLYVAKDEYDKAMFNHDNAMKLARENSSKSRLVSILFNIGAAHNAMGSSEKAINYLNESIELADSIGELGSLKTGYLERSKAFEKFGNTSKAFEDFKAYSKVNDSLFNKTKSQQIEEQLIIYETEKKEQQIQLQQNEIELLNTEKKISNQQLLLLALALLLALLGIYALRQKMKRNKILREKIEADLEFKTKELTTHALHLAKKNEVLNDLKQKAKVLKADANADPGYQMLIQTINFDLQDDNNWENFSKYFEQVHKGFNEKAQQQYPNITNNDLRLMALLKMNLSSKEIANILNISSDGIKKARQRLRKKMGLDSNESLEARVIAI